MKPNYPSNMKTELQFGRLPCALASFRWMLAMLIGFQLHTPISQAASNADAELTRIKQNVSAQRLTALNDRVDRYRKTLDQIARAALRAGDGTTAKAITNQLNAAGIIDVPIPEPPRKNTPYYTELARLRADFERERDATDAKMLVLCKNALNDAIRVALSRGDLETAAVLGERRDWVSQPLLSITRATYGAGGSKIDVTLRLRNAVSFNRLSIHSGNGLGGDPAPYRTKHTNVIFRLGSGRERSINTQEGSVIRLP